MPFMRQMLGWAWRCAAVLVTATWLAAVVATYVGAYSIPWWLTVLMLGVCVGATPARRRPTLGERIPLEDLRDRAGGSVRLSDQR